MSRRWLALCGLVIAVVVAGGPQLFAQGQGRGGFGGGGGFGRGMGGMMGQGGPLGLALMEPVQKEIGLAADGPEIAELKKLQEAMGKEMQETMGKITGGDPMAFFSAQGEERQKMMTAISEATTKLTAKYSGDARKILSGDQYKRVQQIGWQMAGMQALSDPDLVKALDLKKEQQEKITAANTDFGNKQREMFQAMFAGGGGGDREEMQKKMAEMGTSRDKAINDVLTDDQKTKFKDLKGKEFDLASLRPQGRGGFGGGFGGGGGGGGGGRPGRPNRPTEEKPAEKKE
ncbi:MAG: hypothetical protein ACK50P_18440 [Planctomycetaceae bacterium]